jgi:LmbE family N-acetylglucosaminyl deacetylase
MTPPIVALAVAAHPDDIEFHMAGTLLLLRHAGAEIHMWNLANGCMGTATHSREDIIRIRAAEARASAELAGATWHPPLFDDLAIFYDQPSLARVAATLRDIRPNILLTHPPADYMEDHMNTCRLVVSGAFVRAMRNFLTEPPRPTTDQPVAIYHCAPHGLTDGLRRPFEPHFYVDITSVRARKRELLAQHHSQKHWLDVSQGMDAYLHDMETMSRELGKRCGRFDFAEAWRRHAHHGFASADYDPLRDLLDGRTA